jgi:acyl carrier protein
VHRLTGPMNRALFERALRHVVHRQDALRTAIVPAINAEGWRQRIDDAVDFELPFEDLGALPAAEREAEMRRRAQAVIDLPIATDEAPLFRCALYRLGEQEHVFLFMAHHLVWDGYSFDVFYREMAALYTALVAGQDAEAALPATTVSYGDFAAWQVRWLEGADAERQRAHWRTRLAAAPVLSMLAPDTPVRPGTPGEGRSEHLSVPAELSEALRAMARRHNLTLNMVLMAAYGTALANAIGQPAVGIGMPVRGRIVPELEDVMGFFVGLVPVLLEARPALSFTDFATALRADVTGALAHQDLPFQHLTQQASTAQRRAGLYQAVFSFQDTRDRQRHWGPLAHDMVMLFQKGLTDDLGLWLLDRPTGLEGFFVYNASLYSEATAAAFRQNFLDILAAVAASPATRLGDLARPAVVLARAAAAQASAPAAASAPALLQPEQARLAQLWASALDIDVNEIRPDDNFFDLGGDSLMAMRVVQNSREVLGHRVEPRRYVFESLAQLAAKPAAVPTAPGALDPADGPAPARVGLLGRMFQGWGRKG